MTPPSQAVYTLTSCYRSRFVSHISEAAKVSGSIWIHFSLSWFTSLLQCQSDHSLPSAYSRKVLKQITDEVNWPGSVLQCIYTISSGTDDVMHILPDMSRLDLQLIHSIVLFMCTDHLASKVQSPEVHRVLSVQGYTGMSSPASGRYILKRSCGVAVASWLECSAYLSPAYYESFRRSHGLTKPLSWVPCTLALLWQQPVQRSFGQQIRICLQLGIWWLLKLLRSDMLCSFSKVVIQHLATDWLCTCHLHA